MRRLLAAARGAAMENPRWGGPRASSAAGCAGFAAPMPLVAQMEARGGARSAAAGQGRHGGGGAARGPRPQA
jgi:hypothetical protein